MNDKLSMLYNLNELYDKQQLPLNYYEEYLTLLLEFNEFDKFQSVVNTYDKLLNLNVENYEERVENDKIIATLKLALHTKLNDKEAADTYANFLLSTDFAYSSLESIVDIQICLQLALYNTKFGFYDNAIYYYSALHNEIVDRLEESDYFKALLGKVHNNLAENFLAKGDNEAAIVCAKNALDLRQEIFPEDHEDVLQAKNNYAMFLQKNKQYHEALPLLNDALRENEKLFGENHLKVAKNSFNMGRCYYGLKEYEKASYYFEKSYKIKLSQDNSDPNQKFDTQKTFLHKIFSDSHILSAKNYKKVTKDLLAIVRSGFPVELKKDELNKTIERLTNFVLNSYKDNDIRLAHYILILHRAYGLTFSLLVSDMNLPEELKENIIEKGFANLQVATYVEFLLATYEDSSNKFERVVNELLSSGKTLALKQLIELYPNKNFEKSFRTLQEDFTMKLLYREVLFENLKSMFGELE